jgi:hypothetical protein
MKKHRPSAQETLVAGIARGDYSPFDKMRVDVAGLRGRDAAAADVVAEHLLRAETYYIEGNMRAAVLLVWDAGRLLAAHTASNAPKLLRGMRGESPAGVKARAKGAWNHAFNSVAAFRRWEASDQADYLAEHSKADVAGIKRETLDKYVREFCKKAR